jgi:hypothetical protein
VCMFLSEHFNRLHLRNAQGDLFVWLNVCTLSRIVKLCPLWKGACFCLFLGHLQSHNVLPMVWLSEFVSLREYPSLLAMVWDRLNKSVADEVVLGRICPISLGFRSTFSQH